MRDLPLQAPFRMKSIRESLKFERRELPVPNHRISDPAGDKQQVYQEQEDGDREGIQQDIQEGDQAERRKEVAIAIQIIVFCKGGLWEKSCRPPLEYSFLKILRNDN